MAMVRTWSASATGNGAALPQEAMRQAFDFRSGRRSAIHGDQRDVELIAERGEHIAVRHGAHVDQDLAQLIAALQLEFQGALDILGLDLAALAAGSRRAAGYAD